MILVKVEPRADGRYDFHIGDQGDEFANSSQGYENVEDAQNIVRRLWPKIRFGLKAREAVVMRTKYRDGSQRTERLR